MKKILMTTLVSMALGAFAHAAQERGGGSFVVCKDEQGKMSATLLDYYEAKQTMSLEMDMGAPELDYKGKIQYVLNRLRGVDPHLTGVLQNRIQKFESETGFLDRSGVVEIKDRGSFVEPKKCNIVQAASNKLDALPLEKKYLIDSELWDIANEEAKAGLVLHEVIYALVREFGEKNSDHTRYFNALIASKNISSFDASSYLKLLKQLNWGVAGVPEGVMVTAPQMEDIERRNNVKMRIFSLAYRGMAFGIGAPQFKNGKLNVGELIDKGTLTTSKGVIQLPAKTVIYFAGFEEYAARGTFLCAQMEANASIDLYGKKIVLDAKNNWTFGPSDESGNWCVSLNADGSLQKPYVDMLKLKKK